MASMLRWADDNDIVLAVPAGALAEAARQAGDGVYRLHLALSIQAVRVLALDEQAALTTGELCATTGTSDLIAAHSAWVASAQQWAVVASEADARPLRVVYPNVV